MLIVGDEFSARELFVDALSNIDAGMFCPAKAVYGASERPVAAVLSAVREDHGSNQTRRIMQQDGSYCHLQDSADACV